MKNQFFFTRRELIPHKPDANDVSSSIPPPEYKEFRDSINLDKVILTMMKDDNKLLIFMDDYHELIDTVPVMNKQGKQTSFKKEHMTVQSQVTLVGDDIERFYKLTSIE